MHKSQSVETTEEKQSLCDEDCSLCESDKPLSRWDWRYNKWRRVYVCQNGYRRVQSEFLSKCIECGDLYFAHQAKGTCWDCSYERYRKLCSIGGKAARVVKKAVKDGLLPVLDGSIPCKDCGKPACDYDHREYAKPLEVDPVCRSCNALRGPALEHRAIVIRLPKRFRQAGEANA